MKALESTRLILTLIITFMVLATLVWLTKINPETGQAAVGPAFFGLGGLWTAMGLSKVAEHGTKFLRKDNAREQDLDS